MCEKPFTVLVDGRQATALRYDKTKPRAMRVRELKKGIRRRC